MSETSEALTINQSQYLQLEGLMTLAKRHIKDLESIERSMKEILGDTAGDHISDAMWLDPDIRDLLAHLDIEVV